MQTKHNSTESIAARLRAIGNNVSGSSPTKKGLYRGC